MTRFSCKSDYYLNADQLAISTACGFFTDDCLPPEIVRRYRHDLNPREACDLVRDKKRFYQAMKARDFSVAPSRLNSALLM